MVCILIKWLRCLLYVTVQASTRPHEIKQMTYLANFCNLKQCYLLQAWRMVESSTNCLQRISRDFHTLHDRAVKFCNDINRSFSLQTCEEQDIIEVSTSLQEKRIRRRKAQADEERDEGIVASPLERYRVVVFCAVMDKVVGSLRQRFLQQGDLYRDFAFLDPRRFADF